MREWLRLSRHRRISLDEALDMGNQELVEFQVSEKIQWEEYSKSDYYMAQMAFIIASANSSKQGAFKFEDFLIDFKEEEPISEYQGMQNSIATWEMITGKKAQ